MTGNLSAPTGAPPLKGEARGLRHKRGSLGSLLGELAQPQAVTERSLSYNYS